jgi:hypothetical protein
VQTYLAATLIIWVCTAVSVVIAGRKIRERR